MNTELTTIPFHGDQLLVTEIDGKPFVVLKRALENIGLDYKNQHEKLQSFPWATVVLTRTVGADGKLRSMTVVDVRTFLMLLATIHPSKVSEHVRPKLIDYQLEVSRVIEDHFTGRHRATEPNTVTWVELAALIRQRYGLDLEVADITRGLRDAGVLMQDCCRPKKPYRAWFWFTGSAWTIHPHVLPELVRKLVDTRRALGDMQSQLALDLALDDQLRREIGRGASS